MARLRLGGVLSGAVLATLISSSASAQPMLKFAPASDSVAEVRVAVAATDQRRVVWSSCRIKPGTERALAILALPPGAAVDTAQAAWLEALEATTAPRVLAPEGLSSACGAPVSHNTKRDEHNPAGTLQQIAVFTTLDALALFAEAGGFTLDQVDLDVLDVQLLAGRSLLALSYDTARAGGWLPSTRTSFSSAQAIPLLPAASRDVPLTLFSIGQGRASMPGYTELSALDLDLTLDLGKRESDYAAQLNLALQPQLGQASLFEFSNHSSLSNYSVLPDQEGVVQPLFQRYVSGAYENGESQLESCVLPSADMPVEIGTLCPAADLAQVPGAGAAPCSESSGQVAAESFSCGPSWDLAFALSGQRLDTVVLTRHSALLSLLATESLGLEFNQGLSAGAAIRADHADTSGCGGKGGAGTGGSGGYGGSGNSGWGGAGGSGSGYEPVYGDEPPSYVDVSCSGSTQSSGDDSCSGDSSDSSSDDDSCSGDSSDSGSEDSCSGDSSDSGYDGDTCGGGSDDGYNGDSCDSSSSSGSGDSCSGGSSSSGDGCSVARVRLPKTRVSALSFLAAALLLPLRRLGRRVRR